MAMSPKSMAKLRQTQTLDLDRHITFLEKKGREICDQDVVITQLDEFHTEIYVGKQSTINHTDSGKASGKDHVNIDTLNETEEGTVLKTC